MRILASGLLAMLPSSALAADLTVYTYDSFVSEWGPGPVVEAAFEATCGCDLEFVAAGDGAAVLSRLKLEGARPRADVVLGLDTGLIAEAVEADLVVPHGITPPDLTLPLAWEDAHFLPYDWGYFAFVHKADMADVPGSLEALAASDKSIVIQDPRSSTPGLGLLLWVKAAYGARADEIWGGLKDNIVTVTPGWSEAYGLFLEGEADMVLSYTTSPDYHRIAEGDAGYASARFSEGHYMQVEVAGIVKGTDNATLAAEFLSFMLSDGFQAAIPQTNWMFPAVTPAEGLPEGFGGQPPAKALLMTPAEARAARGPALDEWRAALSR